MVSPRNIALNFIMICVASSAAAHSNAKSHRIQNSSGEKDWFLATVLERIKRKMVADETKNRENQNEYEQAEQKTRRELDQVRVERLRAEEVALDAARTERFARDDLRNYRSDSSFLKIVAFESRLGRKEAEERLDVISDRDIQLRTRVEALNKARSDAQKALDLIKKKIEKLAAIEDQIRYLLEHKSTDFGEVFEILENLSRTEGLKSSVLFKSVDPGLQETRGATIRYTTSGQRLYKVTPHTAKCLTSCRDDLEINREYYIWTERDGRKTSTEYKVPFFREKEELVLKEDRSN